MIKKIIMCVALPLGLTAPVFADKNALDSVASILRHSIVPCWNVASGAAAADVVVTVAISLDLDGRIKDDVRLLTADGGRQMDQHIAFQSARRAILRCQGVDGYQLPADRYEEWKEVEMTFDPIGQQE